MERFLGQIAPFGFDFAPKNWATANGQLIAIQQNTALYSLLGTIYGGNGTNTFGLPNLGGRMPIGAGSLTPLGNFGGQENHSLIPTEIPEHTHPLAGSSSLGRGRPIAAGAAMGVSRNGNTYGTAGGAVVLNDLSLQGGNQPHSNMQPYLVLNFCVALTGIYPSRN